MKFYCTVIILIILLSNCLKDIEGNFPEDNIFDPNNEPEIWFEQMSIDSTHIGGIVYLYHLTYQINHPQLLNRVNEFNVGIKRNGSNNYGAAHVHKDNTFSFDMMNAHRVDGVFCMDIGLRGKNSGIITASFYDCFEY